MKKNIFIIIAIAFIFLFSGTALSIEFSADTVMTYKGEFPIEGKIFFRPEMFRIDMKSGELVTVITRIDKKVVWNIMQSEKMYMEIPLNLKNKPMVEEKFEGEIERKEIGVETVNGHPSKKYLITYKVDDKKEQVYQWWATDINFAVRTSSIDGTWVQDFKNVKIEPQPLSIFEVPAGYTKFHLPGGIDVYMK